MHQLTQRVTAAVSATSGLAVAAALLAAPTAPAYAAPSAAPTSAPGAAERGRPTAKIPTAIGRGGAISTVDPEASAAGLKVLAPGRQRRRRRRRGGGHARGDRALQRRHRRRWLLRLLQREDRQGPHDRRPRDRAAPRCRSDAFIDPATGKPYTFTPDLVTSGVSVGTPGTLPPGTSALASGARSRWRRRLKPAVKVATRGFVVDETFRQQTLDNETRFRRVQGDPQALPRRRRRTQRRQRLPQPAARAHLHAARPAGPALLLRRRARQADGRRRPQPAHDQHDRAARPARLPHPQGPPRLRGRSSSARPGSATAATTSSAWRRRRRAAPPSARRSTSSSATRSPPSAPPTRCTTTSRPARSPSPTAASTSATRRTSTCRRRTCSSDTFAAERACAIDPAKAMAKPTAGR